MMKALKMKRMEYSSYDKILNILDVLIIGNIIYSYLRQLLSINPLITVAVVAIISIGIFLLLRTLYIGHIMNLLMSGFYAVIFLYIIPIQILHGNNIIAKIIGWLILYVVSLCIRLDSTPIGLLQKPYRGYKINLKECRLTWACWNYVNLYRDYGYKKTSTNTSSSSQNTDTNNNQSQTGNKSEQNFYNDDLDEMLKSTRKFHSDFFEGCETKEQLNKKYKFWIRNLHPDQQNGDEEMFKIVKEHYEKLKEQFD